MNRKLLLITYGFPPWGGAAMERALMLSRYLPKYGWHTHICCASVDSPHLFDDAKATRLLHTLTLVNRVSLPNWYIKAYKYSVTRIFLNALLGFPDANRLWCERCWLYLKKSISIIKPDAILTTSPPHSVHIIGYRLSTHFRLPWIMDMRDAWVENRMASWYTPVHKIVSKYYYRKAIKRASYIIANTSELANIIKAEFPKQSGNILSIPNGYDEELFQNALPHRPFVNSDVGVLLYSGGTYGGWAIKILRKLCSILESLIPQYSSQVKLFVAGEFNINESYQGIGPITLGHKSIIDIPALLLGADVLVICMPEAEAGSARILLKSYGYARAQKPVLYLGPRNATYNYLASRTIVKQFEFSKLFEAAKWIMMHPINENQQKEHNLDIVLKDSFESRAYSVAKIIDRLLEER